MGKRSVLLICLLAPVLLQAQGYTNWFVGNATDAVTQPLGGACLMGGATENDEAMRWFLQRASGGDILVLRASGSNGYQNYFFAELGVAVNSVETIRFDNASAATSPYVHERIQRAEAIWFAGGDQWNYVNYWRDTAIDSLINLAISDRNIVIGGTSAGLAILGGAYFTAEVNTVTSAQALTNPFHPAVTVSQQPFLQVPYLAEVVTDSHYDNPDRRGRHMVFMARANDGTGINAKGIGCNEYTAVCIDADGIARVYGEWPQYPEYAFFLQINCLEPDGPETLEPAVPLTWFRDGTAVKTYKVAGTMQGSNTFDLNDWLTGSGGTWEDWSVQQGVLTTVPGDPAPDCITGVVGNGSMIGDLRYDQATQHYVLSGLPDIRSIRLMDALGRTIHGTTLRTVDGARIAMNGLPEGLLLLQVDTPDGTRTWKLMR